MNLENQTFAKNEFLKVIPKSGIISYFIKEKQVMTEDEKNYEDMFKNGTID